MLNLNPIPDEPYTLRPKAAKLHAELNDLIAQLNREAAECEAHRERIRTMKPADMTAADITRSRELASLDFDLHRQALALLNRVKTEWMPERSVERMKFKDRMRDAELAAMDELKGKLIELGYDEAVINRDVLVRNSKVKRAFQDNQAAQSIDNYDESHRVLFEAIDRLEKELEAAKRRLLTV